MSFNAEVPVTAVRVFETNRAGSTYAVIDTTRGEELLYARPPEARGEASVLDVQLGAPLEHEADRLVGPRVRLLDSLGRLLRPQAHGDRRDEEGRDAGEDVEILAHVRDRELEEALAPDRVEREQVREEQEGVPGQRLAEGKRRVRQLGEFALARITASSASPSSWS